MEDTPSATPDPATSSLIASDRVEGTKVFGRDGGKLGAVHNFVVDKRSGQVAYVVVSTGGFLGLGQAYHPLPWSAFAYDEVQGGYVVQVDRRMLDGGPSFRPDSAPVFDDAYGRRISEYYASAPAA
ncbi:PRC-barrel domain-containing protein [Sphingomonas crusticola]|uniref:PRC-barrel domain-containing protein n=1 Tax=Sphingomonas crusticola TaxID=1697973 RepID=UPI000E23F8BC|nr:PRC-barrel domain-containing protein [Sphingomonas crusticola]